MRRYFYGWACWWRALRLARTKRHGAGRMRWRYAFNMAASYRWIVDGQMRGAKFPRWLRQAHNLPCPATADSIASMAEHGLKLDGQG